MNAFKVFPIKKILFLPLGTVFLFHILFYSLFSFGLPALGKCSRYIESSISPVNAARLDLILSIERAYSEDLVGRGGVSSELSIYQLSENEFPPDLDGSYTYYEGVEEVQKFYVVKRPVVREINRLMGEGFVKQVVFFAIANQPDSLLSMYVLFSDGFVLNFYTDNAKKK